MEKKDVIRKIKKLMAIAQDMSATDQEIQLATYKANKLRMQYKIEEWEVFGDCKAKEEVVEKVIKTKGCGYIYWVLVKLAEAFQCAATYTGKINANNVEFQIIGLKSDAEICAEAAEPIVSYLNNQIRDLRECYIEKKDFRIYKRDYTLGFSYGLEKNLKKAYQDLKVSPKYELMLTERPEVVEEYIRSNITQVKGNQNIENNDAEAFELGFKHGLEYEVKEYETERRK